MKNILVVVSRNGTVMLLPSVLQGALYIMISSISTAVGMSFSIIIYKTMIAISG